MWESPPFDSKDICRTGKTKTKGNVIIVDDNSTDGTAEEVCRLADSYDIILISRHSKAGIGSAYIRGFKEALKTSDIIFEMDADLSHEPESIPLFLNMFPSHDVVIGSRYIPGGRIENWGLYRKSVSHGGNYLARKLLGLEISDITTGYRAYKKEVLSDIRLDSVKSDGYAFQAEILYRVWEKGYKIKEIPIVFRDRNAGRSKLSKVELVYFFSMCSRIFFHERKGRGYNGRQINP